MNDRDLSAALSAIHEDRMSLPAPPSLHRRARAVPAQTPHQRGWLPTIFTARFPSVFSATRFVVAGAIVALFGGFLLAGVVTRPRDESRPAVGASPSVEVSTPAETSTLVWERVDIPDGLEPRSIDLRSTGSHFVAFCRQAPAQGGRGGLGQGRGVTGRRVQASRHPAQEAAWVAASQERREPMPWQGCDLLGREPRAQPGCDRRCGGWPGATASFSR